MLSDAGESGCVKGAKPLFFWFDMPRLLDMPRLNVALQSPTQSKLGLPSVSNARSGPGRSAHPKSLHWLRRRVRVGALVDFTRSFAVMINARLPLLKVLESAAGQVTDAPLRAALTDINASVQRGLSLSESLSNHPAVFDVLYVQLVKIGELTGMLDQILLRLASYLERSAALKRKVRLAMVYPGLIVAVALGAVTFLLTVIVPTFADMFADFDAELPTPTRIVLGISNFLTTNIGFVLAGSIGSLLVMRSLRRHQRCISWRDRWLLRLPFVGSLLLKGLVARFCRTLGTLLSSGIGLVEALDVLTKSAGNVHLEQTIKAMREAVVRGRNLSQPLRQASLFPNMVVQMIMAGEETAELDGMLLHVAAHYEQEVDAAVDTLTSVIEPVMIVIIGTLLGVILVAMYLPMFDLVSVIK